MLHCVKCICNKVFNIFKRTRVLIFPQVKLCKMIYQSAKLRVVVSTFSQALEQSTAQRCRQVSFMFL